MIVKPDVCILLVILHLIGFLSQHNKHSRNNYSSVHIFRSFTVDVSIVIYSVPTVYFQAFDVAEEHLGIPPQIAASEMAAKEVPDTLMIVSYVSQYHEVFKNETPGNKAIYFSFNYCLKRQKETKRQEVWMVYSD